MPFPTMNLYEIVSEVNADQELTNKIQLGAKYLDIIVLDHIILSADGYNSFADNGLL
jgi:DNA repair protein RadC